MSFILEIKKKLMENSREKKLNHFYSLFDEGQSVLDVGVSTEAKGEILAQNYFLRNYRYESSTYTGLGVQDLSDIEKKFPEKRFVQYSGGIFPFPDKAFDWVFSNAVIEHVGEDDEQLLFLNEMMRVAKNVFFTTPNKFFPVETHTNIFFLHWHDGLFYKWCSKYIPWVERNGLYLFSRNRLYNMLKESQAASFSVHQNRLLGMPMTFTIICNEKNLALHKT